jgi:hypothetical protein
MARPTLALLPFALALTMATPAAAGIQARTAPPGAPTTGQAGPASSGPASGPATTGGSASTTSGGWGDDSSYRPSPAPDPQTPARTPPPSAPTTGTAAPRSGSSSSGSSGGSSTTSSTSSSSSGGQTSGTSTGNAGARDRNGRPITGTADARPNLPIGIPGRGSYIDYYYYPWYSSLGFDLGYRTYSPWSYGYNGWSYGLYGPQYDPYGYDPYFPYGGATGYGYGAPARYSPSYERVAPRHPTGSIRLKVNPETAKVFVDGVLVGTAGEFGGLTGHHLVLEGGAHEVQLRADGYETYSKTLTVEIGKTMTERMTLTKKK